MRIASPVLPMARPVRFGNAPQNPENNPEDQKFAKKMGSASYADGVTEYFLAVNEQAMRATVYVRTTRPNPEQVLKEAPEKFQLQGPLELTYKLYRE